MSSNDERKLSSPRFVRELLATEGLHPKRRWGQNFLCDANVLRRIAAAANLQPTETVLEIGAGIGGLTVELAKQAHHVVAVEIDARLAAILREFAPANVSVIQADFLKLNLESMSATKVVANIPYNITSPIIERLLHNKPKFSEILLLVQKEFAERLTAQPATKAYGAFTLFAQYHAFVKLEFSVSRSCFYPAPDVDSAVVRLTPRLPPVEPKLETVFFRCTRAAFSRRRKTLANALGSSFDKHTVTDALASAGIDPTRRGETLSEQEFIAVATEISRHG